MKIGILGSSEKYDALKIKAILKKLKETYGSSVEIVSGGNKTGVEYDAKKTALDIGLRYKEFNPAYTPPSGFSALSETYYGKTWHPTHDIGRYRRLVEYCDALVIFRDADKSIRATVSYAEKKNKKVVIIS